MVCGNPLAQVGRAQVLALLAVRVVEVEGVNAQLVGHGDVAVVRHAAGDPVVAAHGLQPPDLVHVAEGDAVHLVGAVALQQGAQAQHAVAGAGGVGQDQRDHVLLADAAGRAGRGVIAHQRVCRQDALVGGQGLGGAHAHVAGVETGLLPQALLEVCVGHGRVAHASLRQGHGEVTDHAGVAGLSRGVHGDEALGAELAVGGVLVAGHDGGAVEARLLAHEDGGAGHVPSLLRRQQGARGALLASWSDAS